MDTLRTAQRWHRMAAREGHYQSAFNGLAWTCVVIVASELFFFSLLQFGIDANFTGGIVYAAVPIIAVRVGWSGGLVSALTFSLYSVWLLGVDDTGTIIREVVISTGGFVMAIVCGYYHRKAQLVNEENILYNHIILALHNLDDILDDDLKNTTVGRKEVYKLLNENVRHHLAHAISYISGFKWLYQQMRFQQEELAKETGPEVRKTNTSEPGK